MGREIWFYRGKKWLIGVDVERHEFRGWTDCEGLDVRRVWAHVDFDGFKFGSQTRLNTSRYIFVWVFYGDF